MPTVTTTVTSACETGATTTVTTTEATPEAPVAATPTEEAVAAGEKPYSNHAVQDAFERGLDVETAGLLDAMASAGGPMLLGVKEYRAGFSIQGMKALGMLGEENPILSVETVVVDCVAPAGGLGGDPDPCPRSTGGSYYTWKENEIDMVVFKPSAAATNDKLPCMLWIHGGGYIGHTHEYGEQLCRYVAEQANMVVVAPLYRLSPDFVYPQPIEDCYSALVWTAANAATLGIDADKIIMGGDSAGGNAAGAVAMMTRDRKGPSVKFCWYVNPWCDLDTPGWGRYESYPPNAGFGFFSGPYHLVFMAMNYLGGNYITAGQEKYASMVYDGGEKAQDLANLPPYLNTVYEMDPLHSMGVSFGKALDAQGNAGETKSYAGMIHGCYIFAFGPIPKAKVSIDDAVATFKTLF